MASHSGLLQLAIKSFAKAFEVIPRVLAETSGHDSSEILSKLHAAHAEDTGLRAGIDIDSGEVADTAVLDILATKKSAIDLAVDATNTILSIDQIIMAKELEAQLCHNSQDPATGIKTTERVPFV